MHPVGSQTAAEDRYDEPALPVRPPHSPMTWYVLLGFALLAGTFSLIVYTAGRSARAETRGDQLAALLLEEARQLVPLEWNAPWLHHHLHARLVAAGMRSNIFIGDLELREVRTTVGFAFCNKHYCIEVRPSPRAEPDAEPDDADASIEVLAFPRSVIGPARSVFFHPEDADSSYSRNLQAGYVDEDAGKYPVPGFLHRRNDGHLGVWDYRGFDDERWLLRDRPTQ